MSKVAPGGLYLTGQGSGGISTAGEIDSRRGIGDAKHEGHIHHMTGSQRQAEGFALPGKLESPTIRIMAALGIQQPQCGHTEETIRFHGRKYIQRTAAGIRFHRGMVILERPGPIARQATLEPTLDFLIIRLPQGIHFHRASQDAGALGALDEAGLLAPLPQDILELVPEQYRGADGTWVAPSARARVLAYNSDEVEAADLPTGIDGLLDPRWRGQVGYAPTNASFQSLASPMSSAACTRR